MHSVTFRDFSFDAYQVGLHVGVENSIDENS